MEFKVEQAREVLESTPSVLRALLAEKSAAWLNARKTPQAFSAVEVLGHMMHAEMTDWIPRIEIILEHGETRAFEPFDRFGFRQLIAGKSVGELLDEFEGLRRQSLETLDEFSIEEVQLALRGQHPELGTVTLENLIATWALHDLGHLLQIAKTMANEFRDAVGPWRAYLTILD
jgi:hypothetical protein